MGTRKSESKSDPVYKYGLFMKGEWKAILLATTKEEAEKYRRGKYRFLEIREIIQ